MKKLFLGLLAVSSMAMVSCSQEDEQWGLSGDTFEDFTGEILSNEGSRTSMDASGSVLWSENDTISLFKKTGYHQKYKVETAGSTSATFKYASYSTEKGTTQAMHYAVYPFAEGNSISGTTLNLDLSSLANQSYTANTFENGKAVMVAKSETTVLQFTNAFSLANIQLTAEAGDAPDEKILVNSIKVESASLPLAGSATVDMSQEKPAAEFASTGSKSITLTCTDPVELSATTATNFYVLMPAVTFPKNDLTITIYATVAEEAKEYVVTMTCKVPLLRSKVTTLTKTLEFDGWTGSTSATIKDVEDVTAANTALATNAGVKIADASAATTQEGAITVPAKTEAAADMPHVIDLSEATMPTNGAVNIVVTESSNDESATVEKLEVIVPDGTNASSLNINAPGTTVTITAADGTVIDVIEATTAEQTLVINENVTVKKLIVKKGNVRIKGKVESIESDINTTITLDSDIILESPLTVSGEGQITLDLNGHTISQSQTQTTGYSMINNTGNLTIKNNGTISYADNTELTSAVNYVSNVISNSGILTIEEGVAVINNSKQSVADYGYPHAIDNSGTLTINGGTFTNNANYSSMRIWCTEDDNTIVTINGGTFNGSIDFHNVNKNPNKGTLTINDGTFNADTYTKSAVRLLGFGADVDELSGHINGGTFNGEIALRNYTNEDFNSQVFYISGGTFSDISAFNYLTDNADVDVKLNADVTVTSTLTVKKSNSIDFDLNGHNLSYAVNNSGASAIIENKGTLNISNTATTEAAISFVANNPDMQEIPSYATNTITNDGTLTIGERVIVTNDSDGGASYAVDDKGVFTLNGGKLIGNRCALRIAKFNQDDVKFTMNSGLVKAQTPAWIQLPGSTASAAPTITVEINNGTFQSTKETSADNDVLYTYSFGNSHANTNITINGGEFLGGTLSIGSGYKGDAPTLTIKGGTFEYDVLQWLENSESKVLYEANKQ